MSKLRLTALALAAFTGFVASATSVVTLPHAGQAACYRREYTAEHLQANRKQVLSSLFVLLQYAKGYHGATVIGTRTDGRMYGNFDAGCAEKNDGSVFCQVECDGGSFSLVPSKKSQKAVNFSVTKDYYFPLFLKGSNPEETNAENGTQLSLDGNDQDNNLYKLYPADKIECEDAIKKIRDEDWGC